MGCQSPSASVPTSSTDSVPFDRLWTAYTRCVGSSDLDTARSQADLLHRAAYRDQDARTFLPSTLDRYVERPPIRLAADPRELATACRSHADRIEQARISR